VFFNDAPSCTGGNVARGRASHGRQVFGEKPDEEQPIGPVGFLRVKSKADDPTL